MDMWRFMEGSAQAADRRRHPGHARALRRRSRLRLLRDASSRTVACSRATAKRPTAGCARGSGSSTSSTARPRCSGPRRRARRGVRHRHPHPLVRVDLGGAGVALRLFGRRPIEEFYKRGILGPSARCRPLRLARRPRDRAAGADRHGGDALPVLEHEAVVGAGPDRCTTGRGASTCGARHRRREGEQQPRHARGDEVRVAAAEGQHARPDHRRPVGRPRHGDAAREPRPSACRTSRDRSSPASGPTSSPSTCAARTSPRCSTGRTSTSRPTSCSRRTATTCATCGSRVGSSSPTGPCVSVDAELGRRRGAGCGRGAVRPAAGAHRPDAEPGNRHGQGPRLNGRSGRSPESHHARSHIGIHGSVADAMMSAWVTRSLSTAGCP